MEGEGEGEGGRVSDMSYQEPKKFKRKKFRSSPSLYWNEMSESSHQFFLLNPKV